MFDVSSPSSHLMKKTHPRDTSESVSDNLNNVLSGLIFTESLVTFELFGVGVCRRRRENAFSARALSICAFDDSPSSLSSDESDINLLANLLVILEDVEREDFIFI